MFAASTAIFHLAGQPGRAQLRRGLPALPAPQRARVAAPVRGGRRERARRSSSRPRRRSTAPPSGTRRPEATAAAPDLALRDHEARLRAPRRRLRAELRARRRRPALLQRSTGRASGRTWRSRGSPSRSPRAAPSSSTATAASRASFTYVADVVEATVLAIGAEPGRPTTSAAASRRRCARRSRCSSGSPGRTLELARGAGRRGRQAPDEGRHDADPRRARLGGRRPRSRTGCALSGSGPPARVAAR